MNTNKKTLVAIIGIAFAVFVIALAGIWVTRNLGKSQKEITSESAHRSVSKLMDEIGVVELQPQKATIEFSDDSEAADLPDIDKYKLTTVAETDSYVEIWSSPEKAGTGTDGWLNAVAKDFNNAGKTVNGQAVSVQIRNISSGVAVDYIKAGEDVPDGFSPSSTMWGNMLEAEGCGMELIGERLAGNVPVMLFKEKKYSEIKEKYGSVDIKSVTQAAVDGILQMGYTNPYVSTTGLNFLVTTLLAYDLENPLSDVAVAGFTDFQKNIPMVAYNTLQAQKAVKNGTFDAIVTEYQQYVNDKEMMNQYKAVPFGYRHDEPLYASADISHEKREILRLFMEFCSTPEAQTLASKLGFNGLDDYVPDLAELDGNTILAAQRLWKQEKSAGKPVMAVFVADLSGSMAGDPINNLKSSLTKSIPYIGEENYIGLISYNDIVTVNVPIGKFSMDQKQFFQGGINSMTTVGGTALYDGVIVAVDMIKKGMESNPEVKPMIFLLSDGEPNVGHSFGDVKDILKELGIPVFTIGYNADLANLSEISDVNEAASINADTDDIVYQMKNLFNFNM